MNFFKLGTEHFAVDKENNIVFVCSNSHNVKAQKLQNEFYVEHILNDPNNKPSSEVIFASEYSKAVATLNNQTPFV